MSILTPKIGLSRFSKQLHSNDYALLHIINENILFKLNKLNFNESRLCLITLLKVFFKD